MKRTGAAAVGLLLVMAGCSGESSDESPQAEPSTEVPSAMTPAPVESAEAGPSLFDTCVAVGEIFSPDLSPFGAEFTRWVGGMEALLVNAGADAFSALAPLVDELIAIDELPIDLDGINERNSRWSVVAVDIGATCESSIP